MLTLKIIIMEIIKRFKILARLQDNKGMCRLLDRLADDL